MRTAILSMLLALPAAPSQAQERPSVAPRNMQAITPALADYTDRVLFGDVWIRPELSPRDRSLVTLSVLIATGKTAQMAGHLNRALTNGVTPVEVAGLVTQLAFYSGWPNAVSALTVIEPVFAERKIDLVPLRAAAAPLNRTAQRAGETGASGKTGAKFAELTRKTLFDDLWRRTDLSPRDRSLVTIAALAANGDAGQLQTYMRHGLENGLARADLVEALTHLAFYAGWPKASAALEVAGRLDDRASLPPLQVFPPGQGAGPAPAANFNGPAGLASAFAGLGAAQLGGATVSFEPGARTRWHSHPMGQLLVITDGSGLIQVEGQPARRIGKGDVVWTRPGVRHWHGAAPDQAMTHVAVAEAGNAEPVSWYGPVSDADYRSHEKTGSKP